MPSAGTASPANAKSYEIVFNPGEVGGDEYRQTAYFDQPGTLEVYSDEAFRWSANGRKLHGLTCVNISDTSS